jgi:hypothetical protein
MHSFMCPMTLLNEVENDVAYNDVDPPWCKTGNDVAIGTTCI